MTDGGPAAGGTVAELWRFPVKSMGGERVESARVGPAGLLGDRAYAVIDVEDGTAATAKIRHWAGLFDFSARYGAEPVPGRALPPVWVHFPDGSVLRSDDEAVHPALSSVLGREVVLRAGTDPFVDLAAAHVLTSASLAGMGAMVGAEVDVRRFRPNLLLDATPEAAGFPEDAWVGRELSVGDGVALRPFMPAPRCVMTTLAQPGLPADSRLLAALTREHRRDAGEYGVRPCLGVYADVTGEGTVREGDTWSVRRGGGHRRGDDHAP